MRLGEHGPSKTLCNRANQGGMDTRLHAVADAAGRPVRFFMTAGQKRRPHGCGRLVEQPAKGGLDSC